MKKRDPSLKVEAVTWAEYGKELLALRTSVFVAEQGVPLELEDDGRDLSCSHWRAHRADGKTIGTVRLDAGGRIGRMAVTVAHRDSGAGSLLLREALTEAERRGFSRVTLHAQAGAARFYELRGFLYDGPGFLEAGIPHRPMWYPVDGRLEGFTRENEHGPALRERLRANLVAFERRTARPGERRSAAVAMVVLANRAGQACFVLTKRAPRLSRHGGQWALPGGRADGGETAVQAALRELSEEVGLRLGEDSVLGLLDDHVARSGFVITPVVVWAPADATLEPDPGEVAAVYRVPLTHLEHPTVPQLRRIPQSERPVIALPILGARVHAPTAAMLFQLREVAVHGRATRVDGYEAPVFAWR